jgi:hypothetical protein
MVGVAMKQLSSEMLLGCDARRRVAVFFAEGDDFLLGEVSSEGFHFFSPPNKFALSYYHARTTQLRKSSPKRAAICVRSSIVAAVRIRLRNPSMIDEGLAWELAQKSLLSTSLSDSTFA